MKHENLNTPQNPPLQQTAVSGSVPPSLPEDEVWTELSDNFRKVAHGYKDGHFDYRYVWAWFQEQQLKYDLKRRQ